jgi:HSP20 family protein
VKKEIADMTEAAKKVPVTEDKAAEPKATETGTIEAERQEAQREWWPFVRLRRDIEHAFENFNRGPWRLPFTRSTFDVAPLWPGELVWGSLLAVDIVERDDDYLLTAELPGVSATDVDVKFSAGQLTIKAEKKEVSEEQRRGVYLSERRYGVRERKFQIPAGVDTDKIEASFANGVLTIKLPKTSEARRSERNIDVKAA